MQFVVFDSDRVSISIPFILFLRLLQTAHAAHRFVLNSFLEQQKVESASVSQFLARHRDVNNTRIRIIDSRAAAVTHQ